MEIVYEVRNCNGGLVLVRKIVKTARSFGTEVTLSDRDRAISITDQNAHAFWNSITRTRFGALKLPRAKIILINVFGARLEQRIECG
jgi:hypothetical protein